MDQILEKLQQLNQNHWLINVDQKQLNYLTDYTIKLTQKFLNLKQKYSPLNILIVEQNFLNFIPTFLAAISAKCHLFLGNTQWQEAEWQGVFNLFQPDLIIGDFKYHYLINQKSDITTDFNTKESLIMIPTGGTSGKIKFTIHTWETLTNSVDAFANYFNLNRINSCCLLPLYHVSGLMQLIRSFITNGSFYFINYNDFKQGIFPNFNQEDFLLSLVPTQLQYLLEQNPQYLANFRMILLGGAKPWDQLLDRARKYNINLALVYGMTETASNIVALKPEEFLKGNNSNGKVLSHSQIEIFSEKHEILSYNKTGIITIKSQSLCLGYYPNILTDQKYLITDDLGYFDQNHYLYIIGRNSRKIITGGENVDPLEIENLILTTNLVKDICIMGIADQRWGQVVTAIYVPINNQISDIMIKEAIKSKLASFKHPKLWFSVDQIPRNAQGKINYEQLNLFIKQITNN